MVAKGRKRLQRERQVKNDLKQSVLGFGLKNVIKQNERLFKIRGLYVVFIRLKKIRWTTFFSSFFFARFWCFSVYFTSKNSLDKTEKCTKQD